MRKLKNSELNRVSTAEFIEQEKTPLVLILDNVRSLNNVGSVFRTADAFKVQAVFLCGITATPPHREITKTALGATESVAWSYFKTTEEAIDSLEENFRVLAVEQAEPSISLEQFSWDSRPVALVFGNEVKGVSEGAMKKCEAALEIPQYGTKHSLNIAVSVGVVCWDLFSKHEF